jgi:hypothetical protein
MGNKSLSQLKIPEAGLIEKRLSSRGHSQGLLLLRDCGKSRQQQGFLHVI